MSTTLDDVMKRLDRIEKFQERSHELNSQRFFDQQDRERSIFEGYDKVQEKVLETSQSIEQTAERLLTKAHTFEMQLLKVDQAKLSLTSIAELTKDAEQMVDDVRNFKDAVVNELQGLAQAIADLNVRMGSEAVKDAEQREMEKKALQGIIDYLEEIKR